MSQEASITIEHPRKGPGRGLAPADIVSEQFRGMTILRSAAVKPHRRVLYLNSYGMATGWRLYQQGNYPGQHLWGCLELVRMGYEVAMPEEPKTDTPFFNYRRQDFRHLSFAASWLGREGIVYSGHTILFWTPLLAQVKLLRCPVVTLLYARGENLRFAAGYRGIIALNPAAESRARSLAPGAKVAHLGWGVDLSFFPALAYEPQWFLACGKTRRDFRTLCSAAASHPFPVRLLDPQVEPGLRWSSNVEVFIGPTGRGWNPVVSFHDLIHKHYAGASAALILLQEDSGERYGAGLTQMLEAMALARPVIVTRTGGLASELDVEKEGCGLHVPPNDAPALARALQTIAEDPARAEAMGRAGRRLCETHYNIERFGQALHRFFENL